MPSRIASSLALCCTLLPLAAEAGCEIDYSVWARRQGIESEALVAYVAEADGTVRDAVVIQSAGNKMLDEGAVRVYWKFRYEVPPTLDGKPVRILMYNVVRFSLGKKYPKK